LRSTAQRGELTGYAQALDGLWAQLSPTLTALEHLAAEPSELDLCAELPNLQYALHQSAELVHGIRPPAGSECSHGELALALSDAREATATVAEALQEGGVAAAEPLVWEWRGSLFTVRLARKRQLAGAERDVEEELFPTGGRPYAAAGLLLAGVAAVLGGALAALWPVWALGLLLVAASLPLSR
jgi:hypothetical protein